MMKNILGKTPKSDYPSRKYRSLFPLGLLSSGMIFWNVSPGWSLPRSPTVQSGQIKINQSQPGQLKIIQGTAKGSINWEQFSIGANEGVTFKQPSVNSVTLNRVNGSVNSTIAGTLKANGTVLLINPNGILFSPTSKIDVGSILATTLEIRDQDFLSGNYLFKQSQNSPLSTVENWGTISIREGGFAALVGPSVANHGIIQAHLGQVVLGSGSAFTLDFYRDGLISFEVDPSHQGSIIGSDGLPITTLIEQTGKVQADGGSVFLSVQSGADILGNLINLDGIIQAQTVGDREGKIILSGLPSKQTQISGTLDTSGNQSNEQGGLIDIQGSKLIFEQATLTADGTQGGGKIQISAQGNEANIDVEQGSLFSAESTGQRNAGEITLLSEGLTRVSGNLSAAATGMLGDGGTVETSGKELAIVSTASIDVGSKSGQPGTWTLDPDRLFVDVIGGTLPGPASGDQTVAANVIENALENGNVTLTANELIQVDTAIDAQFETGGNLSLVDQDTNGELTVNLNAPITLGVGQMLTGEASIVNVETATNGTAQNAIDIAAPDAVVNLGNGTFTRGTNVPFSSVIDIDKDLTIQGQGPENTVLSGALGEGAGTRVVNVAPGVTAVLENLALINGDASENNGGGIFVGTGATAALINLKIENNSAALGGGLYTDGNAVVIDSEITGNSAVGDPTDTSGGVDGDTDSDSFSLKGAGGGIFSTPNSDITLLLSDVTQNEAEFIGGGIVGLGKTVINQTTVADNTAQFGAGIVNIGSTDIVNSTISGNIASDIAGGIANGPEYVPGYYRSSLGSAVDDFGKLKIINTTISGNEAGQAGGGLVNYAGDVEIINTTISGNVAEEQVGGLGNAPSDSTSSVRKISIANSIVSGNEAPEAPEFYNPTTTTFESKGFNLVGQEGETGGFPTQPEDIVLEGTVNSVLAPLANNGGPTQTHALIANSPAIDKGNNDFALDIDDDPLIIDQRGGERSPSGLNSGNTIDIGAFEATSSYPVTQVEDDLTIGTLRAAVDFANGNENFNPENIANPEPNTIRFDQLGVFATPQTISLENGQLTLSNTATPIALDGLGLDRLTISGGQQSRLFSVQDDTIATLNNLTLTQGQADNGGAVENFGNLTIKNSRIKNNQAEQSGGGIYIGYGLFNVLNLENTTIEGNTAGDTGGGIDSNGSDVIIRDSSIINNESGRNGGGISNSNSSSFQGDLTIIDSLISGNTSGGGGGGITNRRDTFIQNSQISDNMAGEAGGGILNTGFRSDGRFGGYYASSLNAVNSSIVNNNARSGGGISHDGGFLSIESSDISNNTATNSGGGVESLGSTTIRNSTISNNTAGENGGGIYALDDVFTSIFREYVSSNVKANITASTISSNTAGESGGGIHIIGETNTEILADFPDAALGSTISNSTISGNTSGKSGGGINIDGGREVTASHTTIAQNQVNSETGQGGGIFNAEKFTLNSSVVSGNSASVGAEFFQVRAEVDTNVFNSNFKNVVGQNGDRGGFPDSETVFETSFSANLSPLGNFGGPTQTHALLPGSQAIDAAPNLLETDQRGISRPQGENPDAGAFESQGFSVTFEGGANQSTVVNTEFPESLQFQVNSAFDEPVEGGILSIEAPTERQSLSVPFLNLEIDSEGNVESTITANTVAGEYDVLAGVGDERTRITLENVPGAPLNIIAVSGSPQQIQINQPFETLEARVTDQFSNEIRDIEVSFEVPGTGPSADFTSPRMTATNELGIASVELTANGIGSPPILGTGGSPSDFLENYVVLARSGELLPAEFFLANVDRSVTPPPTSPTPPPIEDKGSQVEKIEEELANTQPKGKQSSQNSSSNSSPQTPTVALTPQLDKQVIALEQTFSRQHTQFLGTEATVIVQPEDIRQQLNKAKSAGQFNPAVIYTFFAPIDPSTSQLGQSRTTGLVASSDQSILLAQAEEETSLEIECLSQKSLQSSDPLWQFDSCGGGNLTPSTRPAKNTDQLVLLLVTPEGKAIRQIVPNTRRSDVLAKVTEFQRSVTDLSIPTNQSIKLGQAMFNWLVKPISEELASEGIDNLVFIMDEGLRSMPLAAMHDGSNYLIENYSVGLMPSMSLADTNFVSVKDMQVLAMGANTFKSQSPLPSVPVEISTIAQDIWQGETFLNETFTPQSLKQARETENYGIVHLATHGEFRAGNRDRSYIQFWDSKVRINELTDLGLTSSPPVSLLVLSACRTALGDPNAELGFTGLAVASGVQTALGGLWYVSDVGTLGLMTSFYKNLKTAPIKAEALRQAQLSLLKGNTRIENTQVITPDFAIPLPSDLQQVKNLDLSHPYYWSGITMIGTPW